MKLKKEGHISVSGGCLAYYQAKVTFCPNKDTIDMDVDNSGMYFHSDGPDALPIKSFQVILSTEEAELFWGRLETLMKNPEKAKGRSTRGARVTIDLEGILKEEIDEGTGKIAIDPFLDEIVRFILTCYNNIKE
ncbi:MAG: hypothetical protein KKH98_06955 [Spirochaetes bacterium]|nr:hypothetical protein [Spirochaetota bacterium]